MNYMLTDEELFNRLISGIDVSNQVMDFNKHGCSLFWFDKDYKLICYCNPITRWFWFNYDMIWNIFENKRGRDNNYIKDFLSTLVEKHFKLKDFTVIRCASFSTIEAEQHFKIKSTLKIK